MKERGREWVNSVASSSSIGSSAYVELQPVDFTVIVLVYGERWTRYADLSLRVCCKRAAGGYSQKSELRRYDIRWR